MNFYISDLHLGHEHAIVFDNRPFVTIEENDKTIIENWNNAVGIEDDVYILGDISWHNSTETTKILQSLNGNKHLIIGNHDGKLLKNQKLRNEFVEICHYKEITFDNGTGLVLSHYPMLTFKNHYYKWWHFYGHVHNSWEYNNIQRYIKDSVETSGKPLQMINVGCMMPWIGYTPKTFSEIVEEYNNYNEHN